VNLPGKLLAIHEALDRGGIPHAFGGAIALAYWTRDPRGTSDLDINIFAPAAECRGALRVLPADVAWDDGDAAAIERDGQRRLWWGETPIDVFFDYVPLHEAAAVNRREVPFEGATISVLGPVELATFKAMFNRTRDWADIEEMLSAETLDADAVRAELLRLVEPGDERIGKLADAVARAG